MQKKNNVKREPLGSLQQLCKMLFNSPRYYIYYDGIYPPSHYHHFRTSFKMRCVVMFLRYSIG